MAVHAINLDLNNIIEAQIQEVQNEASTDKEKKAVHELKAMIADVMQTLSSKGSTKAAVAAAPSPASSGSSYEEAIILLAGSLAEMQVLLTQVLKGKGQDDAKLAQEQLNALEANIKVVAAQIQKQIDAQNNETIWQKIADAFMMVVGAILCAVGLPEIGAVMIVMGLLQITGAMDAITHAIVNILVQDCGMSEKAATILADALIIVVVGLATMGVGGIAAGGEIGATDAVDEGIEMAEMGAEDGAGTAVDTAASDGSNAVKQGASRATRMFRGAVAGATQAAFATNFATNLVAAIPFPDTDTGRKLKEAAKILATIAMMIASFAASFGTGAMGAISEAGSFMTNMGRASALFEGAGAFASGFAAKYGIEAGVIQKELAAPESIEELQETTLSMMNGDEKATAKFMASIQQTLKVELSQISQMFVGQKAMADVMARA